MPVLNRICSVLLLGLPGLGLCAGTAKAATPAPEPPPVQALLAGEFALQAGKLPEAARWYLESAQAVAGDAALAERATRIAMLAGDDERALKGLQLWAAADPDSLTLRATRASFALRTGELAQAREELQSLLGQDDPRAWRLVLGALASGGRDPAAAAQVLEALVDVGAIPDQLDAWQEFGRMALRMDRPELARKMIQQVVQRFPDEPRVALLHATQVFQAGQREQALALLKGVEGKIGGDLELRNGLAYAYDSVGEPAAAERVLARGPQDQQSWGMRAALLARQGDEPALLALYREISRNASKPDPAQRLMLGKIAEFLKRPQEAVDWYHSVPGGPQRVEARLRAANALFSLDRKAEARDQVHALQNDAALEDDARRDAYLLEAELARRDGDAAGELEVLARGLAAYPDENALLYARALAWERADDIGRAEADLRKILVTEPENVAALNALGYTLADRTPRYQEALELIDRARVAEPDNAAIVDSYGWVLYRLGRNDEALVHLRRAWSLAKDPEIAAHVGEVLWVRGEHDEARQFFEEARKLDPDNRALRRALDKLGV